jgi:hypothetical protein
MLDRFRKLKEATTAALLRGAGATPPELRQAVAAGAPPEELKALVEKIRRNAWQVTDEDVLQLKGRWTEDQLFEIIVAAAYGAADARLSAGLSALEKA